MLLSFLRQQVSQCVSLREDLLELRLWDSEKRSVLTRAKARVAPTGVAWQQRLLASMIEFLKVRQDDFVAVAINGKDLRRALDDDVGAVTSFPFSEDERRGGKLDDLCDLGKRAKLVGLKIAEQSQTLEELFTFCRNHDLRYEALTASKAKG